jgi:hypothetical protein
MAELVQNKQRYDSYLETVGVSGSPNTNCIRLNGRLLPTEIDNVVVSWLTIEDYPRLAYCSHATLQFVRDYLVRLRVLTMPDKDTVYARCGIDLAIRHCSQLREILVPAEGVPCKALTVFLAALVNANRHTFVHMDFGREHEQAGVELLETFVACDKLRALDVAIFEREHKRVERVLSGVGQEMMPCLSELRITCTDQSSTYGLHEYRPRKGAVVSQSTLARILKQGE